MLSDEQNSLIAPKLLYVRIAAAIMIGVVCLLIPVTFQISNWRFLAGSPKLLTVIAGFASLMMFSMSFSVPRIFSGSPAPDLPGKDDALLSAMGMFVIETFIQFALLLGAGMMNLVVYSVEHHVASLVLALIALLLMLFFFPRASKASSAISTKLGPPQ